MLSCVLDESALEVRTSLQGGWLVMLNIVLDVDIDELTVEDCYRWPKNSGVT